MRRSTGGRFLRDPDLRAALYESTDGKCAGCGTLLETGWHADHIVPWVVLQDTNLFDMQPLCPSCNARKGTKMTTNAPWEHIDQRQLRPGQRNAIDTIISQVRQGKTNIAIVLPPGYGKSDVIRVSAVMLMLQNFVSRALILEPAENLRGQVIDRGAMEAARDRYNLPPVLGPALRTYEVKQAPTPPFPPTRHSDAAFLSMTIQLANLHWKRLQDWVLHEKRSRGVPPLVFVDEAHTGSDENEWGNTTRALHEAGAIVVLLTGTPYRSDRRRIELFDYEWEDAKPVTLGRLRTDNIGERVVDIFEGHRDILKLKPDYEHTLRESWDVDSPPALCKMTRLAYDFDLSSHDAVTGETLPDEILSLLAPSRLGGRLGNLLRDPRVIKFFARVLVEKLRARQRDAAETAAIVFVGNDRPAIEGIDNAHAREVEKALKEIDRDLDVVIATSASSSEGIKALRRFQSGHGDVVIVKQMGAVGYDVPRLKVACDLSVVRKPAMYVQRSMRIARVWRSGDGPNDIQMTAIYITPYDMAGAALWQRFITDQHGETSLTNVEYITTLKAGEPQGRLSVDYEVKDVRVADSYSDTNMQISPGDTLPIVEGVIGVLPVVERAMTHPDIEKALPALRKVLGVEVPAPNGDSSRAPYGKLDPTPVIDGNLEQRDDQSEINELAKKVAEKRLGRRYTPGDKSYGPTVQNVMYSHKKACGIAHKKPVDFTEDDSAKLKESLRKELTRE